MNEALRWGRKGRGESEGEGIKAFMAIFEAVWSRGARNPGSCS